MSSSSTNPVQNKVITNALSGKVDKVSGKGLSTNDFTNADKDAISQFSGLVIDYGKTNVSFTSNYPRQTIGFNKSFTTTPVVSCFVHGTAKYGYDDANKKITCRVSQVYTTGFYVELFQLDGTVLRQTTTGTFNIMWFAIGT